MICAGIDAGSRTLKVVLLDADPGRMIGRALADQTVHQNALAEAVFGRLLNEHSIARADVKRIVATGYGRSIVELADKTVTEITCHARGVSWLAPGARTVVDIGGQDSKVLRLAEDGAVQDFSMNDRCAAGTGRFIEVVAERLGVPLGDLGDLAARSRAPAPISNTCVVFAETEIIGLMASGTHAEDIVAGVQRSLAARIHAMAGRDVQEPVLFTGGVALVPGMAEALRDALGHAVTVCPHPQFTGALGAALVACG